MFRRLTLVFSILFFLGNLAVAKPETKSKTAAQSDQQISDFSLAGYGEKGRKSWDLSGKTADIFEDVVKLKEIKGNLFAETEQVMLVADNGDFNKADGKVHLEDNVVITTASGAKLTTDSLDWDRKNQLVTTPDKVNIQKENMTTIATGAKGEPNLNKVTLEKDVTVKITAAVDAEQETMGLLAKDQVIITCDGPLEVDYQHNVAKFNNNVSADKGDAVIYCDTMDIYFNRTKGSEGKEKQQEMLGGNKIDKILAKGNVKIVKGQNISFSDEATYTASDQKIVLKGRPKLVIYSPEELNDSFGN
jgi:LPS export ABC transporter protein LptC